MVSYNFMYTSAHYSLKNLRLLVHIIQIDVCHVEETDCGNERNDYKNKFEFKHFKKHEK